VARVKQPPDDVARAALHHVWIRIDARRGYVTGRFFRRYALYAMPRGSYD
jgi:hypothetical protein